MIPKESGWAERDIQTFHIAVQLLDHLEGNKRPGLGAPGIVLIYYLVFPLPDFVSFSLPLAQNRRPLWLGCRSYKLFSVPWMPESSEVHAALHGGLMLGTSLFQLYLQLCLFQSQLAPISSAGVAEWHTVAQICNGHPRWGLCMLAALFWVIWKENTPNSSHYGCLLGGKCFDKWLCASASFLAIPS